MNSIKENESRQTSYRLGRLGSLAATPLGLGSSRAVFPRVAEYSNPGLEDSIPFGENVQTQVDKLKFVGSLNSQSWRCPTDFTLSRVPEQSKLAMSDKLHFVAGP